MGISDRRRNELESQAGGRIHPSTSLNPRLNRQNFVNIIKISAYTLSGGNSLGEGIFIQQPSFGAVWRRVAAMRRGGGCCFLTQHILYDALGSGFLLLVFA